MQFSFADACKYNDKIYLFDNLNQLLLCFSPADQSISLVSIFDQCSFAGYHIFNWKELIIITSINTLDILVYDLETQLFTLEAFEKGNLITTHGIYDYHMMVDGVIWSFPRYFSDSIFSYDIFSKELLNRGSLEDLMKYKLSNCSTFFSTGFGHSYWAAIYGTNKYIEYNIDMNTIAEFTLYGDESIKLAGICYDGSKMWFSEVDSGNIDVCYQSSIIKRTKICDCQNGLVFSRLYSVYDEIIALPFLGESIVSIADNHNTKILLLKEIINNIRQEVMFEGASPFLKVIEANDGLFIFGNGINSILFCSKGLENVKRIFPKIQVPVMMNIYKNKSQENYCLKEGMRFNLCDFISVV